MALVQWCSGFVLFCSWVYLHLGINPVRPYNGMLIHLQCGLVDYRVDVIVVEATEQKHALPEEVYDIWCTYGDCDRTRLARHTTNIGFLIHQL